MNISHGHLGTDTDLSGLEAPNFNGKLVSTPYVWGRKERTPQVKKKLDNNKTWSFGNRIKLGNNNLTTQSPSMALNLPVKKQFVFMLNPQR